MRITDAARERLRSLTYTLTGQAQQRIALSQALIAAISVAERHPEEVIAEATDPR